VAFDPKKPGKCGAPSRNHPVRDATPLAWKTGTHVPARTKSGIRRSERPGAYRQTNEGDPALVLVVDDYMHTREMYAEFLAFVGFRVASAWNAGLAIRAARLARPALVVMDLALPDMTGCEAASILRRDARTKNVPIIAVTAYSKTHMRDVALRSGCDVFLEKPIAPNALVDEIRALLRRTR
jgi:CheY-like chemotaxis protein